MSYLSATFCTASAQQRLRMILLTLMPPLCGHYYCLEVSWPPPLHLLDVEVAGCYCRIGDFAGSSIPNWVNFLQRLKHEGIGMFSKIQKNTDGSSFKGQRPTETLDLDPAPS